MTVIDCKAGGFTVSRVEPPMLPNVAVMVVWPAVTELAKPAVSIVATPLADEDQVTLEVRFCVLPSLKVPVAVNCWLAMWVMVGLAGVTAIDCNTGGFTVSRLEPLTLPEVAVMVVWPEL